jgi:hypothetical protein
MVLLKRIIEETGAKIVLSTSWREHWDANTAECDETGMSISALFGSYGYLFLIKPQHFPVVGNWKLKNGFGRIRR